MIIASPVDSLCHRFLIVFDGFDEQFWPDNR